MRRAADPPWWGASSTRTFLFIGRVPNRPSMTRARYATGTLSDARLLNTRREEDGREIGGVSLELSESTAS
jgi:hypothetical protein